MGVRSRRKGARFEQEVARAFRAVGFGGARRGLGQARSASEVPDVDVDAEPRLWPELKRGRLTSPRAALAQATEAAAQSGRVPVAICRDDGGDAFVTLTLVDFLALYARAARPR
jgi:hypothetical protein